MGGRIISFLCVVINSIIILGEVIYHLFMFKTYTVYPRWVEIACGALAWGFLIEMIYNAQ